MPEHVAKRRTLDAAGDKVLLYISMWTIGNFFGICTRILLWSGKLKIHDFEILQEKHARGNVIVAARHPSLLETFLIPALFWPRFLFDLDYLLWAMPDERLFPPLLHKMLHCIPIDREDAAKSKKGAVRAVKTLKAGKLIVVHPEGGRTPKGSTFVYSADGCRWIRRIETRLPELAKLAGAEIVPLYIDMPDATVPRSLFASLFRELFITRGTSIAFTFGEGYRVDGSCILETENRRLEQAILNV